jgi:hypothetical protein
MPLLLHNSEILSTSYATKITRYNGFNEAVYDTNTVTNSLNYNLYTSDPAVNLTCTCVFFFSFC